MSDLIDRQAAIEAITDELDRIDHVPQWVFDRLEGRLKQLPPAQLGTNLAEVGTREVRGYPIDADALMEKVAEEYGERARDRLYQIIRYMPPAQPEPCEDAVSRKDCLQALSHLMDVEGFRSGWAVSRANVECMLKAMPSVTPKQRTGKWIRNGWAITCSECGYDMPYTVRNFCPNCGAKMTKGVAE